MGDGLWMRGHHWMAGQSMEELASRFEKVRMNSGAEDVLGSSGRVLWLQAVTISWMIVECSLAFEPSQCRHCN